MEFRYPEPEEYYSKSEEKTDGSDQNNNDDREGIGRSYECVFCKRGFTTAQALGGHMNIHRKDRPKPKPTPTPTPTPTPSTSTNSSNYADLGFYSPIPTTITTDQDVFSGQDWSTRNFSFYSNPFSLPPNKDKPQHNNEEVGLDLELRLGFHP